MRWLLLLCLLLLTVPTLAQTKTTIPTEFVGQWRGEGDIIVTWCKQKRMPFDLTIDAQGNVAGTIGDAQLKEGRLTSRSRLMKKLGNKDYLIQAKLDGSIVAAENIRRKKIWLMLDWKENHLEGGMNTSGTHIGGKKTMYLTVVKIVLNRVAK